MTHTKAVQFIESSHLLPADVLLSRGDSDISTGIVELDGGSYSHAALWSGSGVLESTLPVVREVPLQTCGEHALFIDVYRHVQSTLPREAIVTQARKHLGKNYGKLDLGLATLTVAVSSWMPGDWAEMNALYGSKRLARVLEFLSRLGNGARVDELTCSELVTTAFFDASVPIAVHLAGDRAFRPTSFTRAVLSLAAKSANDESSYSHDSPDDVRALAAEVLQSFSEPLPEDVPGHDLHHWEEVHRNWMDRLVFGPTEELAPSVIRAKRLIAGVTWPTNLVTPRLLEHAPDLRFVGRVWESPNSGESTS